MPVLCKQQKTNNPSSSQTVATVSSKHFPTDYIPYGKLAFKFPIATTCSHCLADVVPRLCFGTIRLTQKNKG